jgi:hypothetical protein
MSEENKMDQSISSQAVEDVFLNVEEKSDFPTPSTSQGSAQAGVNISESSIGQEEIVSPVQKEEVIVEPVQNKIEENNNGINTSKIIFYLILGLIILLGSFAIWTLVF